MDCQLFERKSSRSNFRGFRGKGVGKHERKGRPLWFGESLFATLEAARNRTQKRQKASPKEAKIGKN